MRLAVLASGSGTILDAICSAGIPVDVVVLDRPLRGRGGRRSGSASPASWSSAPASVVTSTATATPPSCVGVLAGAGRRPRRHGRLRHDPRQGRSSTPSPVASLNTHPPCCRRSPAGTRCDDALAYGVKVTGCTVHVATERGRRRSDPGPGGGPGARPTTPRRALHERIKAVERRIYAAPSAEIARDGVTACRSATERGAALRLRQVRRRRPGPRPARAGLGPRVERRHRPGASPTPACPSPTSPTSPASPPSSATGS